MEDKNGITKCTKCVDGYIVNNYDNSVKKCATCDGAGVVITDIDEYYDGFKKNDLKPFVVSNDQIIFYEELNGN